MNDFTNYGSDFMGFKSRNENCNCFVCDQRRAKEAAERIKAATCKCGHVGAECFNDSYCNEPAMTDADVWHRNYDELHQRATNTAKEFESYKQMARAENDAMRKAHSATLDQYLAQFDGWEKQYIELSSRIERAESTLADDLTDLQADYARDMANERNASMFLIERINDLQTTIVFLSEMIS
jgi:hypothetical protein